MATKKKMSRAQKAAAAAALAFIVGAAPAAALAAPGDFNIASTPEDIGATTTYTQQVGVAPGTEVIRNFTANDLIITFGGTAQSYGEAGQNLKFDAKATTGNEIILNNGNTFLGNVVFAGDAAANGVTFTNKGTVTGTTTFGAGNDTLVASGVFSDDVTMGTGDDILTITAGSSTAAGKTIDGEAGTDILNLNDTADLLTSAIVGNDLTFGESEIKGFETINVVGEAATPVTVTSKLTAAKDINVKDYGTLANEGILGIVTVDGTDAEFINKAGATVGKADKDATVLTVTAGDAINEGSIENNSATKATVAVDGGTFTNSGTVKNADVTAASVSIADNANAKFVNEDGGTVGIVKFADGDNGIAEIKGGTIAKIAGGTGIDTIYLGGGTVTTIDLGGGNDVINLISDTTDATVTFATGDELNIKASGEINDLPAPDTDSKKFVFGKTKLEGFTAVALAGASAEKAIVVTNKSTTALATEVTPTIGNYATLKNEGTLGAVTVNGTGAHLQSVSGETGAVTLTSGKVTVDGGKVASITGDAAADFVTINEGKVTGDIALKGEADILTVTGGEVVGAIDLGAGANTFTMTGGKVAGVTGGADSDTVSISGTSVAGVINLGDTATNEFTITGGEVTTVNGGDAAADTINLGGGKIGTIAQGGGNDIINLISDTTDATVTYGATDVLNIKASGTITDLEGDAAASKNFAFGKTTLKEFTAVALEGASADKAIVVTNKSEKALATEVTPTVGDHATLKNEGKLGAVTVAGTGAMFENVTGTAGAVTMGSVANADATVKLSGGSVASIDDTGTGNKEVILAGGKVGTADTAIVNFDKDADDTVTLAKDATVVDTATPSDLLVQGAATSDQKLTLKGFTNVAVAENATLTVNDKDDTTGKSDALKGYVLDVQSGAKLVGGVDAGSDANKDAITEITDLKEVKNAGDIQVDVVISDNGEYCYAGGTAQKIEFAGAGAVEFVKDATITDPTKSDEQGAGNFDISNNGGSVVGADGIIVEGDDETTTTVVNKSQKALNNLFVTVEEDGIFDNQGIVSADSTGKAAQIAVDGGSFLNNKTVILTDDDASAGDTALYITNDGEFINQSGGTVEITNATTAIENNGIFVNKGTVLTDQTLEVFGAGTFFIADGSSVVDSSDDNQDVDLKGTGTLGFLSDTAISKFNAANVEAANTQYKGFVKIAVADKATLTIDKAQIHNTVGLQNISVTTYEDSKAIVTGTVDNAGQAMALAAEDNSSIIVEKAAEGVTNAFAASTIKVEDNATLAINREVTTTGTVEIEDAASLLLGANMTLGGAMKVNAEQDADGVATLDLGTSVLTADANAVTFGNTTPDHESSAQLVTTVEYDSVAKATKNGKITTTTGDITLNNTSVNVKVADNAVSEDGIVIAQSTGAGDITAENMTDVSASSAFYTLKNLGISQDKKSLTIDLDVKDAADFAAEGVNPNDAFAMKTVFGNDPRLANTALLQKAIDEAHPEPFSGAVTSVIAANASARNVINTHVANVRGDSSGSEDAQWKLWGQFFGNYADESAHDGGTAYDSKTLGLTFGIDRALNDNFRLGFAYTYMNTNVDSKDSDNENDIDTHLFTLYSDYTFGKGWYLDGHASYGFNKYDVDRYMTVLAGKASADFDGYTLNFGAEIGKDFMVEKLVVTPFLAADYSYISTESYSEHGAGKSNLIVDDQNNNIFETALGVRLSGTFDKLTPELRVAWVQDWAGENVVTNGRFAAGPALSDSSVERDYTNIAVGAGLDYQITDAFKLGADFDFLGSAHRESYGGAINATYEF
ncbi:autotransporter domain-containing protein [Halodesulfovibrio marinisediminis]|uniref:Outer membrane autotransporter barrel domain-containing protein n=1 Tax=Halodesulfovibrio marinisediminis DSM 17456 TaxID=1121457 RepID=A0A1N6J468_9BACT|nr:autotransporter domain-containing protein [Halodesulfovibrio marinisediminis]SIO39077.1 outer membrane autotransporter barrel domain-containing protein [Halodesulfovibrio marinisediminis DSM 17456]